MRNEWRGFSCVALIAMLAVAACGDDDDGGATDAGADGSTAACDSENPCGAGFVCVDERCVAGGDVSVAISPAARACEVLLQDGDDAEAVSVRFGEGAKGSFVRRAPRLALSFVADDDHAVSAASVVPVAVGGGVPSLIKATCFDKDSKELPETAFTLGGRL